LCNVVLGASTENQAMYNQRFPVLAHLRSDYPGIPIWVNIGPALGPVTIREFTAKPDWVTLEGETGANFRHMQLGWAESLLAECREFRIPFYMKQVAARTPEMGKDFIPPHLQVRQYPWKCAA
jgi:protein gp37